MFSQVQEEFASGQGIIKDGDGVNQLCQSVDDIFCHGLKEGYVSDNDTKLFHVM